MRYSTVAALAGLLAICLEVRADDWPQFRGSNSAGVYSGPALPEEFGPGQNELWSVPLGPGHSSPCIGGDRIFLTTYSKPNRLSVVCVSRTDGSTRWEGRVEAEQIETGHPSFNPASSTPATDGTRVVAYFGSFGLVCFDKQGRRLWEIRLPLARSYAGNATSPIIVDDVVLLYRGNHVGHFLLAVDKETGKEIWKTTLRDRFRNNMACTATPVIVHDKIVLHTINAVHAYRIADGQLAWREQFSTTATSTPVLAENAIIVATWNQTGESSLLPEYPAFDEFLKDNDRDGDNRISRKEFPRLMIFHRSEGTEAPQNGFPVQYTFVDTDNSGTIDEKEWERWRDESDRRREQISPHGLIAIPINEKGNRTGDVRILASQSIPEVPSPVYHDGHVYMVKNGGILSCVHLESGDRVYRKRTGGKGTHYASPVIAGKRLYSTSGDGLVTVIELGKRGKILQKNQMQDRTFATPALADGVIYVRTHSRLFAFAKPGGSETAAKPTCRSP